MDDAEKILSNWNKLIEIINTSFSNERKEKLLLMYEKLEDRITICPASAKTYHHECYPGGYLFHVLTVIDIAKKLSEFWKTLTNDITYTDEELIFTALNHDLGKIGDVNNDYYIPTKEDWKIKKGQLYDFNDNIQYMTTSLRSLFLLQHYNITMTINEFLGIMLHDGQYDEQNKKYFEAFKLKSNLIYIIHWADMMSVIKNNSSNQAIKNNLKTVNDLANSMKSKKNTFEEHPLQNINLNSVDDMFSSLFK